jgi:hypothetical protein
MKKKDASSRIGTEVGIAKRGTGKLKIVFKKDGIDALDQFCKLEEKGAIMMSESCAAILSAANRRGYWGHASNRTVQVGLGINYNINRKEFRDSLTGAIESIEAVKRKKK